MDSKRIDLVTQNLNTIVKLSIKNYQKMKDYTKYKMIFDQYNAEVEALRKLFNETMILLKGVRKTSENIDEIIANIKTVTKQAINNYRKLKDYTQYKMVFDQYEEELVMLRELANQTITLLTEESKSRSA